MRDTLKNINNRRNKAYPVLTKSFLDWLTKYSNIELNIRSLKKYKNKIIYDINKEEDYYRAIVDYISGMTDSFAIKVFNELTNF
jgi:dGTPase